MEAEPERDLLDTSAYDRRAMKTSDKSVVVSLLAAVVALLVFAANAEAATLTLKCSGKGPQSKAAEYSPAECTVAAGSKSRPPRTASSRSRT
jgi:plastocyanin